jgi:hypothetical protein
MSTRRGSNPPPPKGAMKPSPTSWRGPMAELSPRQQLLDQISDKLCAALQSDLENGVSSLNAKAAEAFMRNYPALSDVIAWVNDLHMEEMPDE